MSLPNQVAALQISNFFKKRFQCRCFLVNIAKFLKKLILKKICERLKVKGNYSSMKIVKQVLNVFQHSQENTFTRGSFIKRQTSGTTSDNEWQRVTTSGTTSDNEWQRVVQRVATSGTTSDNEWYNKWQQMTTSGKRLSAKVSRRFQTYINHRVLLHHFLRRFPQIWLSKVTSPFAKHCRRVLVIKWVLNLKYRNLKEG